MSTRTIGQDSNPDIHECRPPRWLPKTHATADLGYPGFYPPRPGRNEDSISETNAKNGFNLGHPIPAETLSAQDTIHNRFVSGDALPELEDVMNQVFARRAEQIAPIPASTFRMPSRVTLNDAKRHAWFADLANPDVPLHKLGKSVPHGAKGHDLFDLLHSNNVAIPRAVWFLRVFGANETAGLRNKPSYNPTQYSVDWANLVTSYMRKQLADIALPSAPRAGLNIKQTFKGVLSDVDSRNRWISRFTYSLQLLRRFYAEGMVDNTTFLVWLVQQMSTCNLAQAGFVTRLADGYLDGMLESRALTRPFTDACLTKLSEIQTTLAGEFLVDTGGLLKTLLQRICLALPDAFISPRMWMRYSGLIQQSLTEDNTKHSTELAEEIAQELRKALIDQFSDIKKRNEAMLFCNLSAHTSAGLGCVVSDIQLLNSISSSADLDTVAFFESVTDCSLDFVRKFNTLLTWSITPFQYGDHRPYATVTLIRNWRDKAEERTTRSYSSPNEFIQDQVFDWLDTSEIASDPTNIRSVAWLLGELVKNDLFQYASYIQRLVARGEPGLSFSDESASRHRTFLRSIPLFKSTASLTSQRKLIMYGVRARTTPEESNERKMRKEIRSILPELFGGQAAPVFDSTNTLLSGCPSLSEASRFEQVRTLQQWLLPIVRKGIIGQGAETEQSVVVKLYSITIELLAHFKIFDSVLDLSLFMLEHSTAIHELTVVISALRRYLIIWTCMGATGAISTALYSAHHVWKTRGLQSRGLLDLLLVVDNNRFLDSAARDHIAADISAFTHALHPETDHPEPVPSVLPEILLLTNDPKPEAPSILANSLWYKYRTSYDWAWKVWDNTVASLRQIPVITEDISRRHAYALRYGDFLLHVDEHLPAGFNDEVLQWFLGPGKGELAALSSDAWDVLTTVLLYLSVHGALAITTVLRGMVYPAWQLATVHQGQLSESFLRAANRIFELLLLRDHAAVDETIPSDLFDIQRLRTWRQEVYHESHFSLLIAGIPTLILIEKNPNVPEDSQQSSKMLRHRLCEVYEFRQAAYRNLDAVRDAFEKPLQSEGAHDEIGESLVDALRLILCETNTNLSNDWQELSFLLSPWKRGATAILSQFVLRQLGKQLSQEATRISASACLDELTMTIFRHSMAPEEARFVAEMVRSVDSAIVNKFLNNGLQCITEMVESLHIDESPENMEEHLHRAGELLRVLTLIAEPLRGDDFLLPPLDIPVQERFFEVICKNFRDLESSLTSGQHFTTTGVGNSKTIHAVIFLGRLLQFDLGFRDAWTLATTAAGSRLSSTIFQLALLCSTGKDADLVAFPLLVDTIYYLIDEIPSDPKITTFDPFCSYPKEPLSTLPADMPEEYRHKLRSILPSSVPNSSVANLANAYRDATGTLVYGGPVLNRPWEWMENLGEPQTLDPKEEENEREQKEQLKTRYLVKNSGSIPLETFAARPTGDGILSNFDDARDEGNIRAFEDGLSAESVFKRDWRESRVELEGPQLGNTTRVRNEDDEGNAPNPSRAEKRSTPRASPAGSVRSRASAQASATGSSTSMRQSPAQSQAPTVSDAIDIDVIATAGALPLGKGAKRKAGQGSDDEIEIVEGPVPSKRTKSKSTKARGKK